MQVLHIEFADRYRRLTAFVIHNNRGFLWSYICSCGSKMGQSATMKTNHFLKNMSMNLPREGELQDNSLIPVVLAPGQLSTVLNY